jgi:hypothetical protein
VCGSSNSFLPSLYTRVRFERLVSFVAASTPRTSGSSLSASTSTRLLHDVDQALVVIDCLVIYDAGLACSLALPRGVLTTTAPHLVAHEGVDVHRRRFQVQDLVPHPLVELVVGSIFVGISARLSSVRIFVTIVSPQRSAFCMNLILFFIYMPFLLVLPAVALKTLPELSQNG